MYHSCKQKLSKPQTLKCSSSLVRVFSIFPRVGNIYCKNCMFLSVLWRKSCFLSDNGSLVMCRLKPTCRCSRCHACFLINTLFKSWGKEYCSHRYLFIRCAMRDKTNIYKYEYTIGINISTFIKLITHEILLLHSSSCQLQQHCNSGVITGSLLIDVCSLVECNSGIFHEKQLYMHEYEYRLDFFECEMCPSLF